VVVDVVAIVTTSVPDPEATDGAARLHVAGLVAPLGLPVTAQVRSTVEVNEPLIGATVMVDVLPLVAPAVRERLAGVALRPKLAVTDEPLTTASMPNVWTYVPVESAPVTSTL
jgi:hypothetical protein